MSISKKQQEQNDLVLKSDREKIKRLLAPGNSMLHPTPWKPVRYEDFLPKRFSLEMIFDWLKGRCLTEMFDLQCPRS